MSDGSLFLSRLFAFCLFCAPLGAWRSAPRPENAPAGREFVSTGGTSRPVLTAFCQVKAPQKWGKGFKFDPKGLIFEARDNSQISPLPGDVSPCGSMTSVKAEGKGIKGSHAFNSLARSQRAFLYARSMFVALARKCGQDRSTRA